LGKTAVKKLGLVINPIAGLGGKVGLKGSDGLPIQTRALELGAIPEAGKRAAQALIALRPIQDRFELLTYPAEMGADAAREHGFSPTVIGAIQEGATSARDTQKAAQEMLAEGADLLLFAGGDGTARDIFQAVGEQLPVLGIPAGVKIHSAVFAVNPRSAGELALSYLEGKTSSLRLAEVMDLDEEAYRQGIISPRLYGYLQVPYVRKLLQSFKLPSSPSDSASLRAIAREIIDHLEPDCIYVIGPGTTTRAIIDRLGLDKSLIGVDVLLNRRVIASDANEAQLLRFLEGRQARIIVTPIGGQGYLFGRGNQQISARVLRGVLASNDQAKEYIIVVSTPAKIESLQGRPLLVDTGDPGVDRCLSGYIRVVTGYREEIIYRVMV
jgi:predicted polyphosphate/ATP-dependent NAD kinase